MSTTTTPAAVYRQKIAKAKAFTARQSTKTLAESLRTLDAQLAASPRHTDAEAWRMTRAWIIDALEARYPDASAAVERAFEEASAKEEATGEWVEVDYTAVLLAAIPAAN